MKYSFTFKKGDIFVEFTTSDKLVVEKQFKIWVDAASEYSSKKSFSKPLKDIQQKSVKELKQERQLETKPEKQIKSEPVQNTKEELPEEPKEVFDKASTLLKTINSIQKPKPQKEEKIEQEPDFEKVLEKTIEKPSFELSKKQDKTFLELVKSKESQDKLHHFIMAAYYLSEYEKSDRFTLKQVNSKLMQNLSEVIDHSVLQDSIRQELIEVVPDYTGTSDVCEYTLTPKGEEFFTSLK